ncbi:MAG TPA: TonB-dependent receptor, partial [Pseudonocardiaceae bacterium]|nr:TonB-dependent receptor [Pseudonocardiaceae bacterium]
MIRRWSIGLLTMALGLWCGGPALQAQDAAPGPVKPRQASSDPSQIQQLRTVVVTGSLIRASNLVSVSPIQSVSSAEIQAEGATNIEDVLNSLPQVYTAQTDTTSNNGTGVANINLRGLGPTRTLVLLDGLRLGPGDPQNQFGSAADVNFIPSALVSNVSVLTGGASTTYGSDAVAGVVNFQLKKHFTGIEITETGDIYQHEQSASVNSMLAAVNEVVKPTIPTSQLDGGTSDTTLIIGSDFDGGRAHVTMYADYRQISSVLNGTRNFLACEAKLISTATGLTCGGSSSGAFGDFRTNSGKNLMLNPDGTATFVKASGTLDFNTSYANWLQRPDKRVLAGAYGHDQVSRWADVYASAMFMSDDTSAQQAQGGLLAAHGPTGLLEVPCNNPFLSAAEEPYICQDSSGNALPVYQANGQPNVATIRFPALRDYSYPRYGDLRHSDYRGAAGVRGHIGRSNWTYDIAGTYWESLLAYNLQNDVSFTKIQDAIGSAAYPTPCTAPEGVGCVPLNIFQYFGPNQVEPASSGDINNPAVFAGITAPGLEQGSTSESNLQANVSGSLGDWGLESPWAKHPVSAALGISRRKDLMSLTPGEEMQSADLVGTGQSFPPVSGTESVFEEYAEFWVPLVDGRPLVHALDADLAGRHSSYSISAGHAGFSANTFKLGLVYAPTRDLRFRGSYNRAVRAPNVFELFYPVALNTAEGLTDPCAGTSPTASLAACETTGVTAAQYGTVQQCPAEHCSIESGGNPALQPETANTYTIGLEFKPGFLPGLRASVDYWDVNVDDYVTTVSAASILNGCLIAQESSLCGLIHRGIGGIIFGSTGWISESNTNIGYLKNRGIDVQLDYRYDLGRMGGLLFHFTGSYMLEQTVSSPQDTYNCVGLYGPTCSSGADNGPNFAWRHNVRLTWLTPWARLGLSARWRYLASVKLDGNDQSQPALYSGKYDAYDAVIPAYNYLDLSASWHEGGHLT